MREFAFDLKINAAIRVRAATEADARGLLIAALDCADTNFGAWPNGDPITGEASLDFDPDCMDFIEAGQLFEVDGETVIASSEDYRITENESGFTLTRVADDASASWSGDDQCEDFRHAFKGDETPDCPTDNADEVNAFAAWAIREGHLAPLA
ncbi:hypothetical protein [Microvirga brassicacearum]|uniref:Uncharacterized protein n=1 Tax=Microvirga brassicacearum TaxID=2580413 RepID=A0A5N3PH63_9HYPH|nr:hypothetical protein [Microvirga brassicacearum]KAB0269043.1 hypothetical protein FEZ63_02745 [Microvirga brassicacearum]